MQNPGPKRELTWKDIRYNGRSRLRFMVTTIALLIVVYCFSLFLKWVESRKGIVLNDPLLYMFKPVDLSMLIFSITYLPVIAGVIYSARFPSLLTRIASAYSFLLLLRMLSLYLVPLDPPLSIIPLRDPLLELTVYEGRTNLKDLFFSGHTATHFLFFLLMPHKAWKMFFLVCSVLTGTLVLLQHVHYSVDVFAAPIFAWIADKISYYAFNKIS